MDSIVGRLSGVHPFTQRELAVPPRTWLLDSIALLQRCSELMWSHVAAKLTAPTVLLWEQGLL